jgi:hypothetical protein
LVSALALQRRALPGQIQMALPGSITGLVRHGMSA